MSSETTVGIQILERDLNDERNPKTIWDEKFIRFSESNPGKKFSFMPHSFDVIKNPGHTKQKKVLVSILAIPK